MGLFGPSEEERIAYREAKEVLDQLVAELHVDERFAYLPKLRVKKIKEAGEYDPEKHTLNLNKRIIKKYLNGLKGLEELFYEMRSSVEKVKKSYSRDLTQMESELSELERKMESSTGWKREYYSKLLEREKEFLDSFRKRMEESIKKRREGYERMINYKTKILSRYKKEIKRTSVHELFHALRYRLHPEQSRAERYDPDRREAEDALADFAEAVILDMTPDEILRRARMLEENLDVKMYEMLGELEEEYYKAIEHIDRSLETFGVRTSRKEKARIEKEKKIAQSLHRIMKGYKRGFVAALGIADEPKERKLYLLEKFLKSDNPKEILSGLMYLAKRAAKDYPDLEEIVMTREERDKRILDRIMKEIEKKAKEKEERKNTRTSLVLGTAFTVWALFFSSLILSPPRFSVAGSVVLGLESNHVISLVLSFIMLVIIVISVRRKWV